jgi:hypothetical protein
LNLADPFPDFDHQIITPAFIACAADDSVASSTSIRMYERGMQPRFLLNFIFIQKEDMD